ncbi:MAG: MFS transporter [Anaerolineae bacterium]
MRQSHLVRTLNPEAPVSSNIEANIDRGTLIRSAIACLVGTFILRMAAAVMGNMIHLYFAKIDREVYPISFTMRSAINAVFFLPELFGSPLLGAMSDRYGRKLFILLGPLTGAVAVQITALTTILPLLAITRFLEGFSTASAIPATLGYLSAITSQDEALRARVMGLFEIATFGGAIAGLLLGGPLFDTFQNHAFTVNGIIYLASLAILYFGMIESKSLRTQSPAVALGKQLGNIWKSTQEALGKAYGGIQTALTTGKVWRFAPAWLAINMLPGLWINNATGQIVKTSWLPSQILFVNGHAIFIPGLVLGKFPDQLLFGSLGGTANPGTTISLVGGIILIFFTTGILLWSLIVSRFRRTSLMLFCTLGLPVVVAALLMVNHAPGFDAPLLRVYLGIAAIALMIVSGFTPAALTYLADLTEHSPVNRGAIMGLYTVLFGLGQFSGEVLGGPFGDWQGIDGLLVLTFVLGLVATGTIFWLRHTENLTSSPVQ